MIGKFQVERYREIILQTIASINAHISMNSEDQDLVRTLQYTIAVIRGLLRDFDKLFSREVYEEENRQELLSYIEEYCVKNKKLCPICGSKLKKKESKDGNTFFGCNKFPACRGCRSATGRPSINNAMRAFIAEKLFEKARKEENTTLNRFSKIEYE